MKIAPPFSRQRFHSVWLGLITSVVALLSDAVPAKAVTTYSLLHTFEAFSYPGQSFSNPDGVAPNHLVKGADGKLYGVTNSGGDGGSGVIFRIAEDGTGFTKLYDFTGYDDGRLPNARLLEITAGVFIGTTTTGGTVSQGTEDPGNRYGTIFKLNTNVSPAVLTTLYRFTDGRFTNNQNADGFEPAGGQLVRIADAGGKMRFYGVCHSGGTGGGGTIYLLTTDGTHDGTTLTTLYNFTDGYGNGPTMPSGSLLVQANGDIYGSAYGGSGTPGNSFGTIFKATTDGTAAGTTLTVLYNYTAATGPQFLIQAPDASGKHVFYGPSFSGGTGHRGSIEKIVTGGTAATTTVTQLYTFTGQGTSGLDPDSLVLGSDGNLYGSVEYSTDPNVGSGFIFRLTPAGAIANIHAFGEDTVDDFGYHINTDGRYVTDLLEDGQGIFYGTAGLGAHGTGVVFTLADVAPLPTPTLTVNGVGPHASLLVDPGATLNFVATENSTAGELALRIQYTTTPSVAASWQNLANGTMTKTGSVYTLSTAAYPSGNGIYFRAVASAQGAADAASEEVGGIDLNRSFDISARVSSPSSHGGDDVTYTIEWTNITQAQIKHIQVRATVPIYRTTDDLNVQFAASELSFNQFGSYHAASGSGAKDAYVLWDVADLNPGETQSVDLTIHLSPTIRTGQSITLLNSYQVGSTDAGAFPTRGFACDSPNPSTFIEGLISFSVTPVSNVAQPGGFVTYEFTLVNLGPKPVKNVTAIVVTPDHTRFAKQYPATPTPIAGVMYVNRLEKPLYVVNYFQNDLKHPQIGLDLGDLAAHGAKGLADTVIFRVTFQVQFADPAEFGSISLFDYGAGFAPRLDPLLIRAIALARNSSESKPNPNDLRTFLADSKRTPTYSHGASGEIDLQLQGSIANAPVLTVDRSLSGKVSQSYVDSEGTATSFAEPKDAITYCLTVRNIGASPAYDIRVTEAIPEYTSFVAANLARTFKASKDAPPAYKRNIKTFRHTTDKAGGYHLILTGLELEPNEEVDVFYSTRVLSGKAAPASGTFIDQAPACSAETSVTPKTYLGTNHSQPILVLSKASFAQPQVRALVTSPVLTEDVQATASTLDAKFQAAPNDLPLTDPQDPLSFVPGFQRYYIDYENIGNGPAFGAEITVPVPAHTNFYRAGFIDDLPPSDAANQRGSAAFFNQKTQKWSGGTVHLTTPGALITAPARLSTSGTISFKFNKLPVGRGNVIVDVIVGADAAQADGTLFGGGTVHISAASVGGPKRAEVQPRELQIAEVAANGDIQALLAKTPALSLHVRPEGHVAVARLSTPLLVEDGGTIAATYVLFNDTAVPVTDPRLFVRTPATAIFLGDDRGGADLQDGEPFIPIPLPGSLLVYHFSTNNAPAVNGVHTLEPYSAASITVRFQPLAPGVPVITSASVGGDGTGLTETEAALTFVVAKGTSFTPVTTNSVSGAPLYHAALDHNDLVFLDLHPPLLGNIVAQGAGNIVSQGAGNLLSPGGSNVVIVSGDPSTFNIAQDSARDVFGIVSQGAGNVMVPQGSTYFNSNGTNFVLEAAAGGGANIISKDGAGIISKDGAGLVSQGGGNLLSPNGSNIVAQGAGNIVAQGGLNIVAQGGLNLTVVAGHIVAQGAGNVLAGGGGNIVSQGAGNFRTSIPGSVATVRSAATGSLFSAGGGTFKNDQ